jgi:cellulose synthase/poly-beta-1,6-N-acetylglucosamine synthase-like glycosyltransferase
LDAGRTPRIRCSLGIMAHDEEANIGRLLEAIHSQQTEVAELTEVIVVASGCTDGTEDIVRRWAERDGRIRLVVQVRREGKASAVNLFLGEAREKVLLLCSADLIPEQGTLDAVIAPFADAEVAMTTCRPVPVDDPRTFMGFAAHLLWNLHHEINLRSFKAGELIAFRKIFERIPYRSAVDEASIESVIRSQGYGTRYVGEAVTYNKGPETVRDFLSQRRRIYAGHLAVRNLVGYRVSTLSGLKIVGLMLRNLDWRPVPFLWTWAVAALEAYGRFLGKRDYQRRRDHAIWAIAKTTKVLALPASSASEESTYHPTTRSQGSR